MINLISSFINSFNTLLWSYVLIALLIGLGSYFTIKSGFVQFRLIKDMFTLLTEGALNSVTSDNKPVKGISSFQAFCISTASRVGTGNLAGVAIAIATGGPGAVFWMWIIALVGAGSSFVESTLAQIYKKKDGSHFRGGPAYYMEKALGKRKLGVAFSILITLSFGLIFNSVQANTISLAFKEAFGVKEIFVAIALTLLTASIIFGGLKRIAQVAEFIVPIMASAYVIIAIFVMAKNFNQLPYVFSLIFKSAFGFNQAFGGMLGATIMQGIKRGLFSNEAGMGSAPNAAATAHVSHPVKQGLIQTLGVFTDTLLICTATSFIILISGVYSHKELSGIQLTQRALGQEVGSWAYLFIAICIFLFAFSSIVGNYYYGETNIEFIRANKAWLFVYRLSVISMVFIGSISGMSIVWNLADLFMGLMAIMNLIVIFRLSPIAFAALDDYTKQRKQKINPVFHISSIPGLKNVECWGSYDDEFVEKKVQ